MNETLSSAVDAYIAAAQPFAQPVLERLRADVHQACPGVVETLKWGMPHFMHQGRILAYMAAFKAHAAFGFGHGRQVIDLGMDEQAMGQFGRLTSTRELPPRRQLQALLRKAAGLIDQGQRAPRPTKSGQPKPLLEAPADLAAALRDNPAARRFFDDLAPSHRRDYIEWIVEAKRESTRLKRLQTAVEWLAQGKRRNWRYERC